MRLVPSVNKAGPITDVKAGGDLVVDCTPVYTRFNVLLAETEPFTPKTGEIDRRLPEVLRFPLCPKYVYLSTRSMNVFSCDQ